MLSARSTQSLILGITLALAGSPLRAGSSSVFSYQGYLEENGTPATGLYDFEICLYRHLPPTPGLIGCSSALDDQPVEDGSFTVLVDVSGYTPGTPGVQLELRVRPGSEEGEYTVLSPRQALQRATESHYASSSPWSGLQGIPEGFADGLDETGPVVSPGAGTTVVNDSGMAIVGIAPQGVTSSMLQDGTVSAADINPSEVQRRVTGLCAFGDFITQINDDGSVTCNLPTGSGVSQVLTGSGLTGGPITTTGTISIASGGVGTSQLADNAVSGAKIAVGAVASSDIQDGSIGANDINSSEVQRAVIGECSSNRFITAVLPNGQVECGSPSGPDSAITRFHTFAPGTYLPDAEIVVTGDGLPFIAYAQYVGDGFELRAFKCQTTDCGIRSAPLILDSNATDTGLNLSMTVGSDGNPVMAYQDFTNTTLLVVHCHNQACSAFTRNPVDSLGDAGFDTDIAVGADGFPVISYIKKQVGSSLHVAKCGNLNCSSVASSTLLSLSNEIMEDTSIAIAASGMPLVSFFLPTNDGLELAMCGNSGCSAGTVFRIIDDPVNAVGRSSALAVPADGLPIMIYADDSGDQHKVAKCTNTTCTSLVTGTLDAAGPGDGQIALAIRANGLPVASYFDNTFRTLKYARCQDPHCAEVAHTTVDATGIVGRYSSLAISADGLPVLVYIDEDTGLIKIAKCGSVSCE